jgi:drug/metabolite transporter (DMT)-like permease
MPALKLVQPHVPYPFLLGSLRLLPAGIILIAWAAATGRKHPSGATAWAWIAAFALVDGAMFQGFLAEGLTRTSAGLGSVIIDSQPLTVALLASVLFGETLGWTGVAGLALGVVGLLLVELPEQNVLALLAGPPDLSRLPDLGGSWTMGNLGNSGEFWMLCAAQSMAVGTVMVRYVTKHADSVYATGYHMLLGGMVLLALVVAQEPDAIQSSMAAATPTDIATLSYISLIGGAASYGIFFYNVSTRRNLTALSSLTFLTPLFAVVGEACLLPTNPPASACRRHARVRARTHKPVLTTLRPHAPAGGYLLLGETLSPLQFAGAGVTLAAVWAITHRPEPAIESK